MSGRVRGTMTSMNVLFGSLGSAAFALIAGILFDKIAPWAPFMVVAAGDFTVFFFTHLNAAGYVLTFYTE